MAPKLVKTKTPGVYRRGGCYVVRYRHGGEERKRFARTYAEARAIKQDVETDKRRGEHRETGTLTFEEYAMGWLDTYTGRTSRGFRDSTRKGSRFSIEQRAIPFFDGWLLAEIDRSLQDLQRCASPSRGSRLRDTGCVMPEESTTPTWSSFGPRDRERLRGSREEADNAARIAVSHG